MKRFSKAVCLALLVFTMIFALAGCSTAPKQDLGDIVVTDVQVPETTVEPVEEPVVEPSKEETPVEEPVTEEAVVFVPVVKKYTLFTEGDITVVADKGKATITYPASIISKADIDAAALAAYQAYSPIYDLSEVYYSVSDGVLTLYYPESWGVEELAVAEKAVMDVLPSYVEAVIASYVSQAVEEAAEEVVKAAEEVVEEISEEGLSASISLFGYTATISLKDDVLTIDYPDFITVDEVKAAAAAAYQAYSEYLQGSTLSIDDGYATLKLSFKLGEDEFYYAVNLLESELSYYVATLLDALTKESAVSIEAVSTPVTAETAEETVYTASISVFGYEIDVEAYDNIVKITYPSFITFEEIQAAAAVAYEQFPEYLAGSSLYVDSNTSTAVLSLAGIPSVADLSYAMGLVEDALPAYVLSLLTGTEETTEVAEVAEETTVEETAPSYYETSFGVYGYTVDIVAYGNQIAVSYPDFITNAEVAAAARKAYEAYSQYFQGSELVIDNGTAVLTLAYSLTEDDFNSGVATLKSELTNYIVALLFAPSTEETETVEEVTEVAKVVEQPAVEEQPATEAPATEPAKEETPAAETKTETTTSQPAKTETTTTTTTATATPAKKSNAGLIVLIIVLVAVAAAAVVLFLKKKKN